MAGAQVEIVANQIDKQRLGYMGLSLTEYDTGNEPQIAAGSKVEIGGALFEFTALESATGWAGIGINNDVYIKLVVAGTVVTAAYTTTAPTWSTSKQGWYDGLDRYVAQIWKDAGGAYTLKRMLLGRDAPIEASPRTRVAVLEIGDWNMDTTGTVSVAHGLDTARIREVGVTIRADVGGATAPVLCSIEIDDGFGVVAGRWEIPVADPSVVKLSRFTGGFFDRDQYDATPYNRGWITIFYEG